MNYRDIAIERFGPASSLKLRSHEAKPPGDDEVAIDVAYSGINFADIQMRIGLYPDAPKKPFVPGYEVSGRVAEVGRNVRGFAKGDEVLAGTYFGGYASRVTVPQNQVFARPRTLDLAGAAALPATYFTARVALMEMARVRPGDRVLIEGATGGVGVLAVQMARYLGAEVTGLTTSPGKKPLIEGLGATAYTLDELRADEALTGYDMILNSSGGGSIRWQRKRLGITGRIVCIGVANAVKDGKRSYLRAGLTVLSMPRTSVIDLMQSNSGIFGINALHVMRDPKWIARLTSTFGEIDQMGLRPHVGKVYPATDVAAAHEALATKQATGKLLLAW